MPINETWWNPYRLLGTKRVNKIKVKTIEKFSQNTYSGIIEAELTNLSLFFVGENKRQKNLFISRDNYPFVPGSSLKGMIRSLAEYLQGDPPIVGDKRLIPKENEDVPLTFNMFGYLGVRGKVSFSDALCFEKTKTEKKNYLPGSPKKEHKAFYHSEKLHKFYFHQGSNYNPKLSTGSVPDQNSARYSPINIEPLLPGSRFSFNVYFENLAKEELKLLLYCLSLEKNLERTIGNDKHSFSVKGDMTHKLGRAKGYGLGSVKIEIKTLKLFPKNPADRYSSYKNDNSLIYQDEALFAFLNQELTIYYQDKSEYLENLRKMMIFDPELKETFKYPENNWFKYETNDDGSRKSQNPLKKI